jgi:hypothetical protein
MQNRSSMGLVRSLRMADNLNLTMEKREESFDKIISRFESSSLGGKENSLDPLGNARRRGKDSPVMTERVQHHLKQKTEEASELAHTERVKNNLTKLRNHYCFLPDISGLKNRPTMEMEINDDY